MIQLFIGSNNKTKRLEIDKIEQVVNKRHEAFTLHKAVGYWQGEKEHSAVVTIEGDSETILETIKDLKASLRQDAIGYTELPELKLA